LIGIKVGINGRIKLINISKHREGEGQFVVTTVKVV
jgi:hypothetical protein